MLALLTLITILVMSLLVVRVATVSLTLTGLSHDLARFQARSAFTGAGFTTSESEQVVRHPVRRRIIMMLMLLGNAGIITAVSTLILSFISLGEPRHVTQTVWYRGGLLALGLAALWAIAQSRWLDQKMSRVIAWALRRWTDIDARDYAGLLHLTGDYAVSELMVQEDDWLAERSLGELNLNREGLLVLGIERGDGRYVGAPRGQTRVLAGDSLLLYGREQALRALDRRRAGPAGNRAHVEAVVRQVQVEREERREDLVVASRMIEEVDG